MKRLFTLLFCLLAIQAFGYVPANISPSGALDWMVYEYTDDFGDIIRTIPSPVPASNNALLGACYAEGMLIVFENIYPETSNPRFYKINPDNGAIIGIVNLPFTGYVMGASYDGTGIWVVKWYTNNVIYKIDLNGNIISQFVPATGSYSCRMIAVEGNNLWVGANQGANNTMLYKMDFSGNILSQFTTGTAVGWYMDGEICTQAPSGTNLFVVDNVGNTVKRLSVSGASVTVLGQFASPAVPPDFAEGLAFDGEYLWHNAALATQWVIWCIDDGVTVGGTNVVIDLTPAITPIVIPPGGGNFEYTVQITNNETTAVTFNAWIDATLPNGSIYGPIILRSLTLAAGGQLSRTMTQNVPASAPAGNYSYNGYTGIYPGSVWHSDSFPFSKSGMDGGVAGEGWNLYGWDEDFTASSVPIPDQYQLGQNFPNPFNPQTTINFALPQSGNVRLAIYNTLGEEVAVLLEGYTSAGYHSAIFTGEGLASGIYLYFLKAGDYRAVKKMALLK